MLVICLVQRSRLGLNCPPPIWTGFDHSRCGASVVAVMPVLGDVGRMFCSKNTFFFGCRHVCRACDRRVDVLAVSTAFNCQSDTSDDSAKYHLSVLSLLRTTVGEIRQKVQEWKPEWPWILPFVSLCETLISKFRGNYFMRHVLKNHPGARYSLEQIELVCKDKDVVCSASIGSCPTNLWWRVVSKFAWTCWRRERTTKVTDNWGMGASFQQDLPPKAFGFDSLMAVISGAVGSYCR